MKRKSTFAAAVLVLLSACWLMTPWVFADEVTAPNSQVETAAAGALLDVGIKLSKMRSRGNYDNSFHDIAIALARLGRTETALKVVQWMSPGHVDSTRSEVLRLSVRRSVILGDTTRAAALIPQIKNNNAKADALLTVARDDLRQNKYDDAQKVLFKVTPLVPDNFDALVYTAYLFSQSGNIVVAKRLFDRAEKVILPITGENKKDAEDEMKASVARSQRRTFEEYLLKANFVDRWQRFRKITPHTHAFLDARTMDRLIQLNQIDLAIEASRDISSKKYPEQRISSLIGIALQITPRYPDKALALLDEAGTDWDTFSQTDNTLADINRIKGDLAVSLAGGYQLLGKEVNAQEWLQKATKNASPQRAALWKLTYSLFPLFISTYKDAKSTFPPNQLLHIHDDVKKLLPLIDDNRDTRNLLRQLIAAQIKAGQINEARGNIEFLDKGAKRLIVSGKPGDAIVGAVLSTAELWKEIGYQERCNELLQSVLNAPEHVLTFSNAYRINKIIQWGFVDEGLGFFYSLSAAKQKSPMELLRDLPFAIAKAHPDQFPYELLKANEPVSEARNLSDFVRGLTEKIFQVPEEQEMVLRTYP